MSKDEWKKWVGIVGRMLLAYALVFAQGAWATQNQGTKDNSGLPQKALAQQANEKQAATPAGAKAQSKQEQGEESESAVPDEKPSRDGSHEGIKVHGHWTIEVRNSDGKVITHREFENSLVQTSALAQFLARQQSVGLWHIALFGSGCGPVECLLVESLEGAFVISLYNSDVPLGATLVPSVSGNSLVLSGTFTSLYSGIINSAYTTVVGCPNTIAPASACGATAHPFFNFTSTDANSALSTSPVSVVPGQTVAVTVAISFS